MVTAVTKATEEGRVAATQVLKEGPTATPKKVPGTPGAPTPTPKPTKDKRSFLQDLILKSSPKLVGAAGAAAGAIGSGALTVGVGLLKVMTFLAILTIGGVGAYKAWQMWFGDNALFAKQRVDELRASQFNALKRLRALSFKDETKGKEKTDNLINVISNAYASTEALGGETLTREQFFKAFSDLTTMEAFVNAYLLEQDEISADLQIKNGFLEAITALEDLADKNS